MTSMNFNTNPFLPANMAWQDRLEQQMAIQEAHLSTTPDWDLFTKKEQCQMILDCARDALRDKT